MLEQVEGEVMEPAMVMEALEAQMMEAAMVTVESEAQKMEAAMMMEVLEAQKMEHLPMMAVGQTQVFVLQENGIPLVVEGVMVMANGILAVQTMVNHMIQVIQLRHGVLVS